MKIICKNCGGTIEIKDNETQGVCSYCGTGFYVFKESDTIKEEDRKLKLKIKKEFWDMLQLLILALFLFLLGFGWVFGFKLL